MLRAHLEMRPTTSTHINKNAQLIKDESNPLYGHFLPFGVWLKSACRTDLPVQIGLWQHVLLENVFFSSSCVFFKGPGGLAVSRSFSLY